jgi:hypothetical protein
MTPKSTRPIIPFVFEFIRNPSTQDALRLSVTVLAAASIKTIMPA